MLVIFNIKLFKINRDTDETYWKMKLNIYSINERY